MTMAVSSHDKEPPAAGWAGIAAVPPTSFVSVTTSTVLRLRPVTLAGLPAAALRPGRTRESLLTLVPRSRLHAIDACLGVGEIVATQRLRLGERGGVPEDPPVPVGAGEYPWCASGFEFA